MVARVGIARIARIATHRTASASRREASHWPGAAERASRPGIETARLAPGLAVSELGGASISDALLAMAVIAMTVIAMTVVAGPVVLGSARRTVPMRGLCLRSVAARAVGFWPVLTRCMGRGAPPKCMLPDR